MKMTNSCADNNKKQQMSILTFTQQMPEHLNSSTTKTATYKTEIRWSSEEASTVQEGQVKRGGKPS